MIIVFRAAVAAACLITLSAAGAAQAAPATASASAKAKILKQISVSKAAELDFGTIVVSTTAGSVGIGTDGGLTCDAALTCSGATSAAAFNIAGSKNEFVTISGDNNVTLKNADDATKTMVASLTRSDASLKLSNSGSGSFTVGGELAIAASQTDGVYEGSFNVTVDYQ